MEIRQQRIIPPRSNPSTDVSGATLDNNAPDSAEDDDNPLQPDLEREDEQASPSEQAPDGESEDDNYIPLSEDEVSLGDK